MVELFKFQEIVIRTENLNNKIWFSGQDVFSVLNLTWKGSYDLKRRHIPEDWIKQISTQTTGGKQEMIYMSEQALYMLTFSTHKTETSIKFAKWVADLLVKFRESIELGNDNDLRKHLNITTQKEYSKKINSANFVDGGITKTIEYNVKNCEYHTNMKPYQVIQLGKEAGLKSKQTTSAKEVIRNLKPELACSMSLTDKLVSENGVSHIEASKLCKEKATDLFAGFIKLGLNISELM